MVAKIKIRLSARKKHQNPRVKYDVRKLKSQEGKRAFQIKLQNRFELLQTNENDTVERIRGGMKEAITSTCDDVLGRPPIKRKPWISDNT